MLQTYLGTCLVFLNNYVVIRMYILVQINILVACLNFNPSKSGLNYCWLLCYFSKIA